MAELKPLRLKTQRVAKKVAIATISPVAQICVDTGVYHLANNFDYLIPESISDAIFPGVFVKVPFAAGEVAGYVVSREPTTLDPAKLKVISKLISQIPLLDPELIELIELTCERYACKPWDVIKSAIPARVAAVEKLFEGRSLPEIHVKKFALKRELTITTKSGALAHKINEILTSLNPEEQLLVIVPDERDIAQLVDQTLLAKPIVLTSSDDKSLRYQNYLKAKFDQPQLIIGTRGAIFTPLNPNSTILVFNDGDESMYERRYPTWNVRDIAALRSADFSLHFIGASPSLEIVRLAELGWIKAKRQGSTARGKRPSIHFNDSQTSEISVIKKGLKLGNVLVVMAETGYVNAIACQKCRNQGRCDCGGKLYIPLANSAPKCYLCAREFPEWQCTWCGGKTIRSISKGSSRFAEEIAKAVSGTRVILSKGGSRVDFLPEKSENVLVVASYGCEPAGLYSSVILKSLENLSNRVDLRSLEYARRLIFENMNRLAPLDNAGIHLDISSDNPIAQGLLRNDPYNLCLSEIQDRKTSNLPPFTRVATLTGESASIRQLARSLEGNELFASISVLTNKANDKGNDKGNDKNASATSKLILRTDIAQSVEFSEFFRDLSRYRGIKALSPLQLRMDPFSI